MNTKTIVGADGISRTYTHRTQEAVPRLARILCRDQLTDGYPVLALVRNGDGTEDSYGYLDDLSWYAGEPRATDLIEGVGPVLLVVGNIAASITHSREPNHEQTT